MAASKLYIPVIVTAPPLRPREANLDDRGNGYGICLSCKKFKRLWARLCAGCGRECE